MSEIKGEGKNRPKTEKITKGQSLYASYFGKRIAINSKNSTLKSRLISVAAVLLALPAVGAFFYGASSFFKDPNRPIPLVKAPESPNKTHTESLRINR